MAPKNKYLEWTKRGPTNDKWRGTPEHDKLVIECLDGLYKMRFDLFGYGPILTDEELAMRRASSELASGKVLGDNAWHSFNQSNPGLEWFNTICEFPVERDGVIYGYVDIAISYEDAIGINILESGRAEYETKKRRLFIEVKPYIDSIGDLLRQLRTYELVLGGPPNRFCVASPDYSYQTILYEQGFTFWNTGQGTVEQANEYPAISAF